MRLLIVFLVSIFVVPNWANSEVIDYGHPEIYLIPGEQSKITNQEFKDVIRRKLKRPKPTIMDIGNAWHWKRKYFPGHAGGGVNVGRMNIDQLYNSKQSTGCHDDGLLMISIVREMGVPAIMVDTMGIKWAKEFKAGQRGPYEGHIFLEIYLQGAWWLFDSSSGEYVKNYDPANPVIPINKTTQTEGYYVMEKGKDTWGHGIRNLEDLMRIQREYAHSTDLSSLSYPNYQVERF